MTDDKVARIKLVEKQVSKNLVREMLALYHNGLSHRFRFTAAYFESATATTAPELAASLIYRQLDL